MMPVDAHRIILANAEPSQPMSDAELEEAARVIAYRHPQGLSLTAHGRDLVRVSARLMDEVRRLRRIGAAE